MHSFSHAMKYFVVLMICFAAGGYCFSGQKNTDEFSYHGVRLTLPVQWGAQGDVMPPRPLYEGKYFELRKTSRIYALKPYFYNMPRHVRILFNFPNGPDNKPEGPKAEISIHSIEEYSHIFEPGYEPKSMLQDFQRIWDTATSKVDHRINQELPMIPPTDAYESVVVFFKQIDQPFLKGFRFVTQFHDEASFMSAPYLSYIFQGISKEKTQYILARFPIKLEGLAKPGDKEHLGFSIRDYDAFEKERTKYYLKAARWIEENENKIQPSLTTLDDILRSVQIDNSVLK